MDLALCAVALSLALITLATLAGYYEGSSWDTISDMITRSSRLRNAFALIIGLMIVAQAYYCVAMLRRWEQHGFVLRMEKIAVWFGMALSFGGAIGFAIVSTDIAENQHLLFAAVSFTGTWLYMAVLYYVSVAVYWMQKRSYVPSLAGATVSEVLLLISGVALAVQPSWRHYAEYVYVVSLHAAAFCLCVAKPPAQKNAPGMHSDQVMLAAVTGPIVETPHVPTIVVIKRQDGRADKLAWVGPSFQWSQQDDALRYHVAVVSVASFRCHNLTLDVYDKMTAQHVPACSVLLTKESMQLVQYMAHCYGVPFR